MIVMRRKIQYELALTSGVKGEAFKPAARDETIIMKQDTESPAKADERTHSLN